MQPLTGRKRLDVPLGFSVGGSAASLVFDNLTRLPYAAGSAQINDRPDFSPKPPRALPGAWFTSFHRALVVTPNGVWAYRGGSQWTNFTRIGSTYTSSPNIKDLLVANGSGWRYLDKASGTVEAYDASGRIVTASTKGGSRLTYEYSTSATAPTQAPTEGLLIGVVDERGRRLDFFYDSGSRIYSVVAQQVVAVEIRYDTAGNLRELTWPDGAYRTFVYEDGQLPWAVTGIFDENARRHSTYAYNSRGSATATSLHDGKGQSVNAYVASYVAEPAWNVVETLSNDVLIRNHYLLAAPSLTLTLPTGATSTMFGASMFGSPRLSAQSQPAGSGCDESTSRQFYDANGNVASKEDFNGLQTCYRHDLSTNLEAVRVEGLAAGAACTVTNPGAQLPAGSRKVSTQWHPDWWLQSRQAQPLRITTYVYNGQLDPFTGTNASCVPAGSALPDGKPIAALCRQVEQATTDATGAVGFAAAVDAATASRDQRWTYNADGQMLTHDGPLPGPADTTTYEYYTATSFTGTGPNAVGVTRGDLKKLTPPVGGYTLYKLYNKLGQVLETEDANGVVTSYAYDARQRLTRRTVGTETTLYEYWPTGLIKKVTQPDNSWAFYEHDDAHRLYQVSDSLGNIITYTLDALGNRTEEKIKDVNGSLRRTLGRGIDALGRVQQVTGRE